MGDAYRYKQGEEENANAAYAQAIQLAEKQLAINPTNWRSVGQLGMYYAYAGRHEEAVAQIEKLLENSSDLTAYYFATRVRSQIGDMEGAYGALVQTVEAGWPRANLATDPDLAALREDTGRFRDILKQGE